MPQPPGSGQPERRPAIEPTRVTRRRRTEALAELMKEWDRDRASGPGGADAPDEARDPAPARVPPRTEAGTGPLPEPRTEPRRESGTEPSARPGAETWNELRAEPGTGPRPEVGPEPRTKSWAGHPAEETSRTGQLPPVPPGEGQAALTGVRSSDRGSRGGPRHVWIGVAVVVAALLGFGAALLLVDRDRDAGARTLPAPVPTTPATEDPDGPGTLREGHSGPEVTELQERLRRIPNVYEDGPAHGRYDAELTEAVARFQLWYGIRGDETGVYGDDTRLDLESRTGPGSGSGGPFSETSVR